MQHKYIFLYYWKSILVVAVICYLSFASPSTFNGIPAFENEDKLIHLLMYGGLTGVLMFDFRQYARYNQTTVITFILISLALPVFLGGAVEIIQPTFFPPRTADWMDWFSDNTGVLCGWFFMSLITRKIFKRKIKDDN